jgi:phosphopantetheinyl transferase
MLRFGLAWYLHKTPADIRLTTGWRGKRRLAENLGLSFNVAHSDGLGLLAFATAGEVGIDLDRSYWEKLAKNGG